MPEGKSEGVQVGKGKTAANDGMNRPDRVPVGPLPVMPSVICKDIK